ncbi:MAG TPA: ABC transporter permease [Streptosporangiaceae bacterium]|nr:ABC transporter permease [Streptosporangiaceae bacterium]
MTTYLVRRALQAIVVLALISMLVYGFLWLLPGGPQQAILAGDAQGAQLSALRHDYGIGNPAVLEYVYWLGQVLSGNLGYSYVENASVGSLLAASLPRTLALTLTATAIGMAVAIPAGLTQAVRRDKAADRLARALSYVGYGMPSFFLGSILILIFGVRLHWLGAEGPQAPGIAGVLTDWRDLTLPVLTLAVVTVASFSRYVRTAAIDSLGHDYVRTARAGGAGHGRVLGRHVLRNSLIPVITLAGLSIPRILAGALVVESLFNIQGMGWRLWQAAQKHDFPVLLGFILVIGAGAVIGSLLADVGYVLADPRVRHGRP